MFLAGKWSHLFLDVWQCDWCPVNSLDVKTIDEHEQTKHAEHWLAREIARESAEKAAKTMQFHTAEDALTSADLSSVARKPKPQKGK